MVDLVITGIGSVICNQLNTNALVMSYVSHHTGLVSCNYVTANVNNFL